MTGAGYLLVRAGARRVGLPVAQVVEVIDPGRTYPVPAVDSAVRGVVRVRGTIVPLLHLGTLLDGGTPPPALGGTGVVVSVAGGRLCLEVDEAESVVYEPGLPVPPGMALPLAVAVSRHPEGLVSLLDLTSLAGTLTEVRPHEQS